jgi:predicted O-linked N-acetylglucosamine transferase (SPINDLY family)
MSANDLLERARGLQRAGNLADAARAYALILRDEPRNVQALYELGLIFFATRQFAEAERLLTIAVRVSPDSAELAYARGCALQHLERHEDALAAFARALAIAPDFVQARNNRGVTLLDLDRPADALACFDQVLKRNPELALVHKNRATALSRLGRAVEALEAAECALAIQPDFPDAMFNRGSALAALGRHVQALSCFDQVLAAAPQHVDALAFRGIELELQNRPGEALEGYDAGLRIRPGDVNLLFNRSSALSALGRHAEVIADCDRILTIDPHFKYAEGNRLFAKMQCCDWSNLGEEISTAMEHQRSGYRVLQPLQAVTLLTCESDLLDASRIWVTNECPPLPDPLWAGAPYRHDRIRIAYVSADFGFHPVMVLAVGAFEQHDRSRFEITAISAGQDDGSAIRHRLNGAFDRFLDVSGQSAREIAGIIRDHEIDIVVDLMGFTQNAPTSVFAHRPAGIQVNFLGFPGTTAAPYIDYTIADRIVIGEERQAYFSESIAWLPHCCLPNDNRREIGERPERAAAGLPESGLVFANFGKSHKLTPDMFAIWMRLLAKTPESVLWLASFNGGAQENLRREAERHGVDAGRILFAPFLDSPEDHLARLSLADLFLDTFPYNAHSTACDFLWAGVPVLTLQGGGFAGRAGASILSAAGMQSLIANSMAEYESIGRHLANGASALSSIRESLAENRATSVLFDTVRFTRNLENAFETMWQRQQGGAAPASFLVEEVGGA